MSDQERLLPPSQDIALHKPYQRREYVIAFFAILILVGFYFSQDEPQALQVPLKQHPFSLTGAQFNFIYFITNFPNVLLSVAAGIIIDKIGVKKAGIIFSFGILLAQSLVTFSLYWKTSNFYNSEESAWYIVLLVGRALLGMCGENVHIVQAAMLSIVVPVQHISTILGLCLSIPLLFTSLNSLVSTEVYDAFGSQDKIYVPFLLGAGACLLSFVGMIGAVIYFTRVTKKRNEFVEHDTGEAEGTSEKIECKQIKELGLTFWLIMAMGFALPGVWYGFLDNVVECFHQRFGLDITTAGKFVMIPYVVCSLGCPLYGFIANKFPNKRKLLIFLVPTIATLSHFVIFIIPNNKEGSLLTYTLIVLGLFLLGVAFSGYVSIVVPSISLVVDDNILGTAFGLLGMANATSESVFPMISSVVIEHWSSGEDESDGYKINSLLFVLTCSLAMMAGFTLLLLRNKKARELDNLEEFEEWDGEIVDREIDELFENKADLDYIKEEVKESQEGEIVMKVE